LDKIDFLLRVQKIAEGVDQVEPLMADLLSAIKKSPLCRPEIEAYFEQIVRSIDIDSVEVLQYCMHGLRWEGLRVLGSSLLREGCSPERRRLYERFLESFSDSWPERDLYDTFME